MERRANFRHSLLACAFYFIAPALFYGALTSRLPSLKATLGATDSDMGAIFLALGLATVAGLLAATVITDRQGAARTLVAATVTMTAAMVVACLAPDILSMTICLAVCGIAVGSCDVAMNAQGIAMERAYGRPCLSTLHAFSGIGGALGALSGSFCAWLGLTPFVNLLLLALLFLAFMPCTLRHLLPDPAPKKVATTPSLRQIAPMVWLCALMGLVCHVAEGSAGEWGSLLLNNVKGASQQTSGLAFVAFTTTLVLCRLCADKFRQCLSDASISFVGSLIGAAGMSLVLLSPWPALCITGYAIMGAGLAPIAPILFSRAGQVKGISPAQASGIVSLFSYAGLLLLPPLLGILAQAIGLDKALSTIVCSCLILAAGGLALGTRRPNSSR